MSNIELEKLVKKIVESEIFVDAPEELINFLKDDEFFISMHFNDESEDNEEVLIDEYYLVSKWLGEKLLDKNQPVFELSTCYLWGRTCSTSLYFDEIITNICNDIL
jgi:hypothetical protein